MTFDSQRKIMREFMKMLIEHENSLDDVFKKLDFLNINASQDFIDSLNYVGGIVDPSIDYTNQLLQLKRKLTSSYSSTEFREQVTAYIDKIPMVLYQHAQSVAEINGLLTGKIYDEKLAEYYVDKLKTELAEEVYAKELVQKSVDAYRKLLSGPTSLKDMREELVSQGGKAARYSKQIILDANRTMIGEANDKISSTYALDGFIYDGGLRDNSRPMCVLLVGLKRPIGDDEMTIFLKREDLQPGLMPNTTKSNFKKRVAGYGCHHHATPVRLTDANKKTINQYHHKEIYKITKSNN